MSAALAKLLIVDDEIAQMTALCKTLQWSITKRSDFRLANEALAALREHRLIWCSRHDDAKWMASRYSAALSKSIQIWSAS